MLVHLILYLLRATAVVCLSYIPIAMFGFFGHTLSTEVIAFIVKISILLLIPFILLEGAILKNFSEGNLRQHIKKLIDIHIFHAIPITSLLSFLEGFLRVFWMNVSHSTDWATSYPLEFSYLTLLITFCISSFTKAKLISTKSPKTPFKAAITLVILVNLILYTIPVAIFSQHPPTPGPPVPVSKTID
jgi:hypothetical protein